MNVKAAFICTILATTFSLSASAAQTFSCEGESLSIKISLGEKSEVQSLQVTKSSDPIVRQNIETAASGKISGPTASIDNALPIIYQATFPSPSPQGLGAVTLSTNKENSKAEVDYDNDDGDMRAYSLKCAAE